MGLTTDFNTSPYYDDFDETKNFHRVLFKPGVAVQARELTQLQTILQKQVERFGNHVFQNGSVVTGGQTFLQDCTYVHCRLDLDIVLFSNSLLLVLHGLHRKLNLENVCRLLC